MGATVRLTAADGHVLDAWQAEAAAPAKGAVVVVQEIFGVNAHIRAVVDSYAAAGYDAIAPALFDRVRPGVDFAYDDAGIAEGRELAAAVGWDDPTRDIAAAAEALRPDGRVGVVGYCWGGSWAWVAACRLGIAAAACYYGRHIVGLLDERPNCPMIMHFGAEDASIPLTDVETIAAANPDVTIHVYEGAGHGFNCDMRASWHEAAAKLARERTLAFFETFLPKRP